MQCLKSISAVKVVNFKYLFNDEQSLVPNRKYGLGIGKYQIRNIPTSHPMAILNNDCSDNIIYYGNNEFPFINLATPGQNMSTSNGYSFYTGTIHIIVKGDFQKAFSAACMDIWEEKIYCNIVKPVRILKGQKILYIL